MSRDRARERGSEARREVLGDDHVDAATARTTPFTAVSVFGTMPGFDSRAANLLVVEVGLWHTISLGNAATRRGSLISFRSAL